VDLSWEYINRSQTHECESWDLGLVIPFLGIFVLKFRYCVVAVYNRRTVKLKKQMYEKNYFYLDEYKLILTVTVSLSTFNSY
jgi:hypothetical protein